jgi:glycolate oxidase FAD binding subunit
LPSDSEQAVVAEPSSVEEAAAILADASRSGRRVSIERDGGDIVLSTRKLDRVLEHEAGDLTATVEAGIRLSALNARLAGAGQMLALDPPGDPTVGACLAANLTGPRRHRYGAPRDLVLGATLVLADGTVASAGGKVVKNVAGYDLGKLVCGTHGRFALIARVSLRLHPLPASSRSVVVQVASSEHAATVWQRVHTSQLVPSAVDLLWKGSDSRLALLFEGSERAVAAQVDAACGLLGGEPGDDEIWSVARDWQARSTGRISFPPRGLAQTLESLPEALVRPGAGSAYVMEGPGQEPEAGARALAERVRAALDPAGVLA